MLSHKKFFLKLAPVLILFSLFLVLKFYLLEQKAAVHPDESATFTFSFDPNKDYAPYPSNGKEETHSEFHNNMYGKAPSSASDVLKNIYKIRKDHKDIPHTNLYYSLVNIVAINSQDTFKALIFRGGILNIILFSISFFTAFNITGEFTTNSKIRLLTTLSAFISSAALSNSLFIREYQLQETSFLLLAYIVIKWYKIIRSETTCAYEVEEALHRYNFLISSIIVSFSLLSGYFGIPLIIAILIFLIIMCIYEKNLSFMNYIIILFITSIIFAFAIYPDFMIGIFGNRGKEAINKVSFTYFINNINYILKTYFVLLSRYVYSCVGLCIISIYILFKIINPRKSFGFFIKIEFIIFISCIIWGICILYLAPYKSLRYIMAFVPLMITMTFFILPRNIYLLLILSICIISTNANGIQNLNTSLSAIKDNNILIIYKNKWRLHTLSPYMENEESKITLLKENSVADFPKADYKKFDVIIIEKEINNILKDFSESLRKDNEHKLHPAWTSYRHKE